MSKIKFSTRLSKLLAIVLAFRIQGRQISKVDRIIVESNQYLITARRELVLITNIKYKHTHINHKDKASKIMPLSQEHQMFVNRNWKMRNQLQDASACKSCRLPRTL